MTADSQVGVPTSDLHGVLKGRAVRHQGCGADNPFSVAAQDAFVDVGGEAEVIGVHDKALHG